MWRRSAAAAVVATLIYFVIAYGYPPVVRNLPRSRYAPSELSIIYLDERGIVTRVDGIVDVRARDVNELSD